MHEVKHELPSPAKKRCLNAPLIVPKVEKESTPKRQAAPAEYTSPEQAAPAKDPKRHKPCSGWNKLRTTPSRLAISLGTPTPPRGNNRQATALHEHRHARPPPPLLASSLASPGTGGNAKADPGEAQAEPAGTRGDTGGTGSGRAKGGGGKRERERCVHWLHQPHLAFERPADTASVLV